jgi:hypothetical protein
MFIRILALASIFAGCAATGTQLTPLEEKKFDPAIKQLVLGTSASRADYDVTPGAPGEEKYGVIVRTDNVEELKSAGFAVTSSFGDVAVVRATIPQIRSLVRLPSVKNVSNGSKNHPL